MMMRLSVFSKSISSLSDTQLMNRVSARGDDRAFDELYNRHSRRLMGFLFRQLGGDGERAADLMQDAFLRVWSKRERYKPDGGFLTWLFSIAYNLLKNEYRHSDYSDAYRRHIQLTHDESQDENISTLLDNKAFDDALQKELRGIDPQSRMLFSLRYEEDMPIGQIAMIMDIPEGTVKSRLHTLIQKLKEKLNSYDVRR